MPKLLHRTLLGLVLLFGLHTAVEARPAPAPAAASGKATACAKAKVKGKAKAKARVKAKVSPKRAEKPVAAPPRRIPRGTMTLRNVNTRDHFERFHVAEISRKGKRDVLKLSDRGKKKLAWMLRDSRTGRIRQPPERLLAQLYQVQQHFDAPVEIISGYRQSARRTSRHFRANAVDFRVEGVDPRVVWDLCRQFKDVGCGYYPTSGFVHMDVREESYAWTDLSGPGEPARYVNPARQSTAKSTAQAADEE